LHELSAKVHLWFLDAGKMTLTSGDKRFQNGAQDYAAYLETPEGRLRTDLAFANLRDFLPSPQANIPLHALDVGCGTGAAALLLAGLGFHVTLLDSSQAMLDIAKRSAEQAGVTNRVTLRNDDALRLTNLFDAASFDIVLCHDILEYVEDPTSVLRQAARALRDTSAILSIVVRNQAGEVFKAAIQAGDLAVAAADLSVEWGHESLYGGRVRLFTATDRQDLLDAASLTLVAERGIRVVADYLPANVSRTAEYARILELESKLGSRPEYAAVARYTHCLARSRENAA
jgi:S-adenosylmethionine-dependent methyltransferase